MCDTFVSRHAWYAGTLSMLGMHSMLSMNAMLGMLGCFSCVYNVQWVFVNLTCLILV